MILVHLCSIMALNGDKRIKVITIMSLRIEIHEEESMRLRLKTSVIYEGIGNKSNLFENSSLIKTQILKLEIYIFALQPK